MTKMILLLVLILLFLFFIKFYEFQQRGILNLWLINLSSLLEKSMESKPLNVSNLGITKDGTDRFLVSTS